LSRLPVRAGEWIDRSRPLAFRFESRAHSGFAGDTVSSALAAAGVRVLGRSFKYHRRRGILSFANHDANAMMQWGGKLNVRADVTPLEAGMDLVAVNTRGGLENDRLALFDKLSAFLPVGFYYKAFHTPKAWFPKWENMIRRASGLGAVTFDTPRVETPKRYGFCDVLVIGAGPSGLSAALAAASAGAKVVVVDENPHAGGSLGYQRGGDDEAVRLLAQLLAKINENSRIELKLATEASGYYADHWVPLTERERITKMRARAVIVASGGFEQPAVFRNNDLPGVMLASATQRLIYRYGVKPMSKALVLASNSDGYRAALDLHANGVTVAGVFDLRAEGEHSQARARCEQAGIAIFVDYAIYEALPNARNDGVGAARLMRMSARSELALERRAPIECDGIVMSVGWAPALNLLYQAGAKARYEPRVEQFVPAELPPGVFAAGRVNGMHALSKRLQDGERAGFDAAGLPQPRSQSRRRRHRRVIRTRSSSTRRARTSSTLTKICSSRTSTTPRKRVSTTSNC
jgi:sarcosine oxidase, subunit alpha